jgi:hypothetical protein
MSDLLETDSHGSKVTDDSFYQRGANPDGSKKAELKLVVERKFSELERNHCKGKQALESLLKCVKRMLAIETRIRPNTQTKKHHLRVTAAELSSNLKAVQTEADDNLQSSPDFYKDSHTQSQFQVGRRPPSPSTVRGGSDLGPLDEEADEAMLKPTSPRSRRSSSTIRREAGTQFSADPGPSSVPLEASIVEDLGQVTRTNPPFLASSTDTEEGHPVRRRFERSSSESLRQRTFP